jgi:S-adenosylmethionine:tRNA ribosyltransferase-isomerase
MLPNKINIEDYNYPLPDENIALFPVEPRDSSKLLKYNKGTISHHQFTDITELLPAESMLVFNQTKVIQARLNIRKRNGTSIEILLLEPIFPSSNVMLSLGAMNETHWKCMIGNKKRWKENEVLQYNNILFEWINREENSIKILWNTKQVFAEVLSEIGNMPIPPYLKRDAVEKDNEAYQTVYAQNEGSVAAPTAGLHFTDNVLKKLLEKNIKQEFITLHVGAGTFKPVSTENALEHEMHAEKVFFTKQNILSILHHNGPVIPVGTTSMRSLESLYWFGIGLLQNRLNVFNIPQYFPYEKASNYTIKQSLQAVIDFMEGKQIESIEGVTSIYIVPEYQFRICKGIITNFHQPCSTLLLLISALIGNNWKIVYEEALKNKYRFLSYGDSSLLLP